MVSLSSLTSLSTIYSLIPSMENAVAPFVCIYNHHNQRLCYTNSQINEVKCDTKYCKINFTSTENSILNYKLPHGITIIEKSQGIIPIYNLFGVFDKEKLNDIKPIIKNIQIQSIEKIDEPFLGLPPPPKSCRWLPWSNNCVNYIIAPDWKFKIFKGWKKTI